MISAKKLFLFFKNNFKRNNHCKFIHHKSCLKPFLSYLPCIVCKEYFSIIFNVKNCTLYLIKYGNYGTTQIWKNIATKITNEKFQICTNDHSSNIVSKNALGCSILINTLAYYSKVESRLQKFSILNNGINASIVLLIFWPKRTFFRN